MGLKTLSLTKINEQTEDIYEAVVVLSLKAKQILRDRIVEKAIRDEQEEEFAVFDEVKEDDPDNYVAKEKPILAAVKEFLDGNVNWYYSDE